nr:hypothetical protein [Lachnospiraceae bacterium]
PYSDTDLVDVGDFSGQTGILGYRIVDLNKDGTDEMIILRRSCELIPDEYAGEGNPKEIARWTTSFEVVYLNDGSPEHTDEYPLTQINGSIFGGEGNYKSGYFEVKILLKERDSGFEIVCSDEYGSPMWADGTNVGFMVYSFDGRQIKEVTSNSFVGSDGFNEDGDFSKSAVDAGMDETARFWKDDSAWNEDNNAYLVSPDEPQCEDLLHVKTETDFDYSFYDNPNASLDDYKLLAKTENYLLIDNIDSSTPAKEFKASKQEGENKSDTEGAEFETVYGSKFEIPDGFANRTQDSGEYEHNNAAGGYTYRYENDSLGMTIEVIEFVWANFYGAAADYNAVLEEEYELKKQYYSDVTEPQGNSFTLRYSDEGGKEVFEKIVVDDSFYHDIVIQYPQDKKEECQKIADRFVDGFSTK